MGLEETFNAIQTLMNAVTRATKKTDIQSAIDQYHGALSITPRVSLSARRRGEVVPPFTVATPPEIEGVVDFSPYVEAARGRVQEMLKRIGTGAGASNTSFGPADLDRQARGRTSLILTGSRGDLSTAPTSAPTLLGDVGYGKNKPGS